MVLNSSLTAAGVNRKERAVLGLKSYRRVKFGPPGSNGPIRGQGLTE